MVWLYIQIGFYCFISQSKLGRTHHERVRIHRTIILAQLAAESRMWMCICEDTCRERPLDQLFSKCQWGVTTFLMPPNCRLILLLSTVKLISRKMLNVLNIEVLFLLLYSKGIKYITMHKTRKKQRTYRKCTHGFLKACVQVTHVENLNYFMRFCHSAAIVKWKL